MQMSLQLPVDKDLFDGPHAEYEAANSLISILHGWLAKSREGERERDSKLIALMLFFCQKKKTNKKKTQYWFA